MNDILKKLDQVYFCQKNQINIIINLLHYEKARSKIY